MGSFSSNLVPVTLSAASWHVTVRKKGRDTRADAARSWERVAGSRAAPSTEKPRAAGSCRPMPDGYIADGQAPVRSIPQDDGHACALASQGALWVARCGWPRRIGQSSVSAWCSPWPPAARPAPARELRVHRSNSQWGFENGHRDIFYAAQDLAPAPAVHCNTLRPNAMLWQQDVAGPPTVPAGLARSRRSDRAAP